MSQLPDGEPSWHDLTFQNPGPRLIRGGQMDATVRFLEPSSVSVYDYIRAYTEAGDKFARLQVKEVATETVRDLPMAIHQRGASHHSELEDEFRDFLHEREDRTVQLTDTATVLIFERHELF